MLAGTGRQGVRKKAKVAPRASDDAEDGLADVEAVDQARGATEAAAAVAEGYVNNRQREHKDTVRRYTITCCWRLIGNHKMRLLRLWSIIA
jgi:hypothetical protein